VERAGTLSLFLTRELFRSLVGIVPLAAAVAFGQIAFEYGMDQAQFITVAGLGLGMICLLTTLLLAGRANRAPSTLLVVRLHRRVELLIALVVGAMAITTALALLVTAANLAVGRLTLEFPSALWIVPTWLALWLLMASLALPLSGLVSRGGLNVLGYTLLTAVLVANDQRSALLARGLDAVVAVVQALLWPVSTLLSQASAGNHASSYWQALCLTLACAAGCGLLTAGLFRGKDLTWNE